MSEKLRERCFEYTVEILQREWSYIDTNKSQKHILATPGIKHCTCCCGFDEEKTLGFMAHYDTPFSLLSLPCLILSTFPNYKKSYKVQVFISGGWCFFWSPIVRLLITFLLKYFSRKRNLEITVLKYKYQPSCTTQGYQLNIKKGKFLKYSKIPILRGKKKGNLNPVAKFYNHNT